MRIDNVIDEKIINKMIAEVRDDLEVNEYDLYEAPYNDYALDVILAVDDLKAIFHGRYEQIYDKLIDFRNTAPKVIEAALMLAAYCEKKVNMAIKSEQPEED